MDWGALIVDDGNGTTLLELLKLHLGITDSDSDDALNRALGVAGPVSEVYLDRMLAKREVEEYFPHHFGTVVLHEPQYDTTVPVEVSLDGVDQTDYSVFLMRGKVAHLTRTGRAVDKPMDWRKFEQVVVKYTAGFDPLPVDVANALVYTASDVFASEGTGNIPGSGVGGGTGEIKSMSIADVGSITYDVGAAGGSVSDRDTFPAAGIIPNVAAQMLSRYKRMSA